MENGTKVPVEPGFTAAFDRAFTGGESRTFDQPGKKPTWMQGVPASARDRTDAGRSAQRSIRNPLIPIADAQALFRCGQRPNQEKVDAIVHRSELCGPPINPFHRQ